MAKLQNNLTTYLHSSLTSGVGFAVHSGQTFQETEGWISEIITTRFLKRYHLNYNKIIFISKLVLDIKYKIM